MQKYGSFRVGYHPHKYNRRYNQEEWDILACKNNKSGIDWRCDRKQQAVATFELFKSSELFRPNVKKELRGGQEIWKSVLPTTRQATGLFK